VAAEKAAQAAADQKRKDELRIEANERDWRTRRRRQGKEKEISPKPVTSK
jgi:hypothetical protein